MGLPQVEEDSKENQQYAFFSFFVIFCAVDFLDINDWFCCWWIGVSLNFGEHLLDKEKLAAPIKSTVDKFQLIPEFLKVRKSIWTL